MAKRRAELATARKAAGHTQESLAAVLDVDRSTVIRWEAGEYSPLPYLRPKLGRILRQSPEQLRNLIDGPGHIAPVELNPDVEAACSWLDQETRAVPGTSRRRVISLIPSSSPQQLRDTYARRAGVRRSDIARALHDYYADQFGEYRLYDATCNGLTLPTSILTRPDWNGIASPLALTDQSMRLQHDHDASVLNVPIDSSQAVRRLAEVQALGVRLVNEPIYRLLSVGVDSGEVRGAVGLAQFARYALTTDLLEGELLDALANGHPIRPGSLPLRDMYLPTIHSITNLPARSCAGGVLALFAVAQPAKRNSKAGYIFLAQERSSHVVNAMRQLAVIPKGFHQPLTDDRADSQLAQSLLRELDEELFGRSEVDNTSRVARRSAQPMHPQRMSTPLRWLTQEPGRLRLECTAFGFNLVSGNYEFACLAAVEDSDFWSHFGGQIEANWEATGIRVYSTTDIAAVRSLIADESWSNEGLFALSEGLRRVETCADRSPS